MPFDQNRVQKEIRDVASDTAAGVELHPLSDDLRSLIGCLRGPPDSPYEGGYFYVAIELEEAYPFVPPRMRFETKLWHPNVSSASGAICLDVLSKAWSPALTLKTALLSLQALLACPQPDDPQDAVVAKQALENPEAFKKTARYWTDSFAVKRTSEDELVGQLADMGFAPDQAKEALRSAAGDLQKAMEKLLGG